MSVKSVGSYIQFKGSRALWSNGVNTYQGTSRQVGSDLTVTGVSGSAVGYAGPSRSPQGIVVTDMQTVLDQPRTVSATVRDGILTLARGHTALIFSPR